MTGLFSTRGVSPQTRKPVFLSFDYQVDVMRVSQIRQIGALEDKPLLSPNEWEKVQRGGDTAVEQWIDTQMKYKSCVIVLIGRRTAERRWVEHEIVKAWNEKRGLFGIHINALNCPRTGVCSQGANPFANVRLNITNEPLDKFVPVYTPDPYAPLRDIQLNINSWIDRAVEEKASR
ncbi:TIR domain-containing protein [Congregibacter brevis]|uniref:TIR domain-containing protein n=1 Tax=Congregibacter brevis TaxID=3081201 RepID=A0ABZ0I9D8_9GAMM|nr:TIR domain-containing protein [Congregibacter sp. IMCC45268]